MKTFSALVASLALATSVAAPAFAEGEVPLNVAVSTQAVETAVVGGTVTTGAALTGVAMAGLVVVAGSNGSSSTTTDAQ